MAERNLRVAAELAGTLTQEARALEVDDEEIAAWRDAAAAMHVPYDERLRVHPQAEGFTRLAPMDFDELQYPLLLHVPYFRLYSRQVVKQADLVLALFFRGDRFTAEEKARNFNYYEAITVRDSSLSACTQAVMAAEVGHVELAYDYFGEAALMDLGDLMQNTRDGLHIASLAGSWIAAVAGFGGMRDHGGELSFRPRLPAALSRLVFRVGFRGRCLRVAVRHGEVTYEVLNGEPLEIVHDEERLRVVAGEPVTRPWTLLDPGPEPQQPPGRAPHRRRPR
jgi:alpha,alpha-trehalose phosphorylase